jgi:hypothetical protein
MLSYLQLGLRHILSLGAADHLLFLATLMLAGTQVRFKTLLILVTAFTIGHALTLALATLDLVRIPSSLVEQLIPATIIASALLNIWPWRAPRRVNAPTATEPSPWPRSILTGAFGLIHGLGFSGVLRQLLGSDESLLVPLLAFNLGIEVAQIVVITAFVAIGGLLTWQLLDRRALVLVGSGITLAGGAQMLLARLP